MRYLVNYILVAFLGMSFLFSGCEASDFEFDSGWDDNAADSSRVTVDTVQGIDVSMYEKARLFPGLVDTASERRIADPVNISSWGLCKKAHNPFIAVGCMRVQGNW